jgi:hypothetical protein
MKPLLIVSILLIIIILGGASTYKYLRFESEMFNEKLSALDKSIDNEDWNKANELYKLIADNWDKSKKRYSMLIEHFEIDNINMSIAELKAFIKTKNQSLSKAKISSLKTLIMHMSEKEAFTLENIF